MGPALRARSTFGALALAVGFAACGRTDAPTTPARLPRPVMGAPSSTASAPARRPPPVEWVYWEPMELDLHAAGKAPPLPLAEDQVQRVEGAAGRWAQLPEAAREGIRARGFAVVATRDATRIGALYRRLADERVPFVVTIDVLARLAHVAFARALAEVEDRELAPALGTMLGKLDARLGAEARGARSDLLGAYAMAHGVVAVARALSDASYALPPELAPVVEAERQRVVAHAGAAESLLLGTVLDYGSFAPRGPLEEKDARVGLYRAVAWLGHVPFFLLGRAEAPEARVAVGAARTQARAALLLARLFDVEIDKDVARAWATMARIAEFVGGAPDDVSPVELAQLASTVGLDVRDAAAIENVVLVDKLRFAAGRKHATWLYDGAGALASTARPSGADAGSERFAFPQGSLAMRVLGPRMAPDADALQALVFPRVGASTTPIADGGPPARARRALPSGVDIAAWLGSAEAREVLRETRGDAFEGFDAAFDGLVARRPKGDAPERHASLYVSGLDAIATYLAPSAADAGQPYASSGAWRRRKIEVALGMWTAMRHDTIAFARRSLGLEAPPATASADPRGFVEAHPEAIGKLLSLVRQAGQGLGRLASLPKDAPAQAILAEVEQILTGCLRVALREANDEPLGGDDLALLASLPARLEALDVRLARSGEADVPIVVDVHTDVEGARVLEEATGGVDEVYLVVREPRSDRLTLAVGASIPHYELAQPIALRLSDEAWRARLRAGSAPPRHAFSAAYVIEEARGNVAKAP